MCRRQRSQEAESALAEVGAATLWPPDPVRDRAGGDPFLLETRESHAVRSSGLPPPGSRPRDQSFGT